MKKLVLITMLACLVMLPIYASAGVVATQVGEVECVKRMLQGNDKIKVLRIVDPDNPFVAIFFTTIKSGQFLAMADPSNTAIAARLIAPVPMKDGQMVIDKRDVTDIASISKSIGSKVMKIARFYDPEMNTLCYLVYTTKFLDGSLKHSLSVVPLGMPLNK
jgi:CreA protein